jgi:hyperosmotically inducible protein
MEPVMKSSAIPALFAAALFSGAAFAQLPEVAPMPVPKSTPAQAADDNAITTKVRNAIATDPALSGMEVTVETADAVVTLNGSARAADQVSRAIALAKSIDGVKSIVSNLAVRTS